MARMKSPSMTLLRSETPSRTMRWSAGAAGCRGGTCNEAAFFRSRAGLRTLHFSLRDLGFSRGRRNAGGPFRSGISSEHPRTGPFLPDATDPHSAARFHRVVREPPRVAEVRRGLAFAAARGVSVEQRA